VWVWSGIIILNRLMTMFKVSEHIYMPTWNFHQKSPAILYLAVNYKMKTKEMFNKKQEITRTP
jgi:hypothetical protein